MVICLTGSSGFLGKQIKTYLKEKFFIEILGRHNDCDYKYDLCDVFPSFQKRFDIVIHIAGKAHSVPKTKEEGKEFFKVNYDGTLNLLNALDDMPPANFVFVSSVAVYGLVKGENISEEYLLEATDPYGKSKIEAELLVKKWCNKNNVICTILRLPLVVDSNPPGNLGSMIKGIKKGYYFNIAGGNAKKSMVLASDVAKFILSAAEIGGTYNLTDGYNPTFNELSKHIASQIGKSIVPNIPYFFAKLLAKIGDFLGSSFPINSNKLAKITSPLTFDDTKAREVFGWNPTHVLEGFKLKLKDE